MMEKLSDETIRYIISRVLDNAKEAIDEKKTNPNEEFYDGKSLAYYEVLDTIKNELIANNIDLKEFGLDFDLENTIL